MKIEVVRAAGIWSSRGEFCRLAKSIWASHGFPGVVHRCEERLVKKANGYEIQVRVQHDPNAEKKLLKVLSKHKRKGKK